MCVHGVSCYVVIEGPRVEPRAVISKNSDEVNEMMDIKASKRVYA